LRPCWRSLRYWRSDRQQGLKRYDQLRRPVTAEIVLSNRQQGPEAAMQLVEDRAPNGFSRLNDVVADTDLKAIADRYKQLAGFAVEELNSRVSLAEPMP